MNINKASLKVFRQDFQDAVKDLEEKHGISIDLGNIAFNDDSFRSKIEVTNVDPSGNKVDQGAIDFEKYANRYGLTADHLNKEFSFDGTRYILVGLKPRNRKYPFIVKRVSDGAAYKMSESMVLPSFK